MGGEDEADELGYEERYNEWLDDLTMRIAREVPLRKLVEKLTRGGLTEEEQKKMAENEDFDINDFF